MASRMAIFWVIAAVGVMLVAEVHSQTEAETCHDNKPCPEDEYCDPHSFSCSHCSEICSMPETRYDCSKKCKDYLILQRIASLENDLHTTIIVFAVILLLAVAIVIAIVIRWCGRNGYLSWVWIKRLIGTAEKSNPPTMEYTHENPHTKSPKLNARNGNNNSALPLPPGPPSIYIDTEGAASVQTVSTPISRGYPAEDWRENHAYDNGGLAITPTENTYEYVEAKMNQRR